MINIDDYLCLAKHESKLNKIRLKKINHLNTPLSNTNMITHSKTGQMSQGMMIILGVLVLVIVITIVYSQRGTILGLKELVSSSDSDVQKCTKGIDCSFDQNSAPAPSDSQPQSTSSPSSADTSVPSSQTPPTKQ
jgi:hypothetical protein